MPGGLLIVVADDYGRAPAYDAGILEAARARAVDAVSVIVTGSCDSAALLATGIAHGLHLRLTEAETVDQPAAVAALREQIERFERLFGVPPAHLDGHRHCHAVPSVATGIAREAARLGMPLRSVSTSHRKTLRALGVATADRLVGRFSEREPVVPVALRPLVEGRGEAPPGITEWMVHPGHSDPAVSSRYDLGREEDLRVLLELGRRPDIAALRRTHAGVQHVRRAG